MVSIDGSAGKGQTAFPAVSTRSAAIGGAIRTCQNASSEADVKKEHRDSGVAFHKRKREGGGARVIGEGGGVASSFDGE
jgi:hypothetical protein